MCSGSEAGSYARLIDFVYHSTLGLIVIKKKKIHAFPLPPSADVSPNTRESLNPHPQSTWALSPKTTNNSSKNT